MAKDPREYGYEGEMVMSQLKGIMNHAKQLHDMLEPSTDLPEWVQSKITLAYDYMQTAADYMATEMSEEWEVRRGTKVISTHKKKDDADVKAMKHLLNKVVAKEEAKPDYSEAGDAERIRKRQDGWQKTHDAEKEFEKRAKSIKHAKEFLQRYKGVNEESTHSVHVKTYDSQGQKQMNSPEFKKHVTAHGGELDYPSDKGAAFKFKSASHAAAFHRGVQSKFKELDSEHDMHEDMAMGTGPVNVAANVANPDNKKLFTKPMKRFKSFKAK